MVLGSQSSSKDCSSSSIISSREDIFCRNTIKNKNEFSCIGDFNFAPCNLMSCWTFEQEIQIAQE
jgi:hypothetical protein